MKREMWNYRCDCCFAETPVYADNGLCYYCDPDGAAEVAAWETEQDAIARREEEEERRRVR